MDSLRAARYAEQEAFDRSDEGQAFNFRKKRINELQPQALKMPAAGLTVDDILFIGERPKRENDFQSWDGIELRYYTQERLDRLASIWDGIDR